MTEKIEIVVKKKEKDGYHAYVRGSADFSSDGNTRAAALGNLLMSNQDLFNVEKITTIDDKSGKDAPKKKTGGLFSGVLKSSLPPRGW